MAKKSKRKSTGLVEGDVDAARYVTVHKVRKFDEHGRATGMERKIEPLEKYKAPTYDDQQTGASLSEDHQVDGWNYENDTTDNNGQEADVVPSGKKTQRDYILQFVQRVDEFLGVLLTREALPHDEGICTNCETGFSAVWRCDDCSLGKPMCRRCMRKTHQDDPFHKIRRWTGKHFRSAHLWEVGVHIFIPHYQGVSICEMLNLQKMQIEREEAMKDEAEQDELRRERASLDSASANAAGERGEPRNEPQNFDSASANVAGERGELDSERQNLGWASANGAGGQGEPRNFESASANMAGVQGEPCNMGSVSANGAGERGEQEGEATALRDKAAAGSSFSSYHATEAAEDQRFFAYLDNLRENNGLDPLEEPGDDAEVDEAETEVILPMSSSHSFAANPNSVRVVHTNGIHNLPLITCSCRGAEMIPADLIARRLLPTSFVRVRTLFSVDVLDKFCLSNLELQASAYQFYHLLRRLTSPMNPSGVVDLYNEFRRMTRLWRWMKKLKWAGYAGHNGRKVEEVRKGELANYCPACPQPGINLPNGWENDPNKYVYRRVFVADGNFKADHVQPKKPSNDIWLSEGSGMIPKREEYHAFLKSAIEKLTGAPCETTFRAITGAMQASKSCDVTGVVGIACARHGCYAPNALVDLFKGEQQKNVDFALLAALKSTGVDPRQGLMIIYDIICQFIIYLKNRIGHLLPEGLDIDRAIGLFHVHAHKDECLFRYSPSFIPGAARVIGEILEPLWSKMNGVSPTARTATLAHRAEMLDDHASDSNHNKALSMPNDLCKRYVEAVETRDCSEKYFLEVSQVVNRDLIELWTKQVLDAEARRLQNPQVMDIYAAKGRGQDSGDEQTDRVSDNAIEEYISFALIVEEKQIEIRHCVRQLTKSPRHADPHKLQGLRDKIQPLYGELDRLQEHAEIVEKASNIQTVPAPLLDWADEIADAETTAEPTSPPQSSTHVQPIEERKIYLPSYGNVDTQLAPVELKARIAQANSYLAQIRNLIAEKSFQYSDVIRNAPRKGVRTRSRARVDEMNHRITFYSQLYTECRVWLINLGADENTLQRFQVLKKDDVKTSTAILDPNKPGSTRIRLSWIWHNTHNQRFGPNIVARNGEIHLADPGSGELDLEETDPETLTEFKRVHWLRARAQFHRWREEATLLDYEMNWTVRFFLHKAEWWRNSAEVLSLSVEDLQHDIVKAGRAAYADRQDKMWTNLARRADYAFHMTNPTYKKMF